MAASNEVKNKAICPKCQKVVPAHHETQENRVLLVKECPDCGTERVVVSTNSARYQQKRGNGKLSG